MPAGMSKRLYKKRYKAVITQIADKIEAAFSGKAEKKRWISQVTNLRMQDIDRRIRKHEDHSEDCTEADESAD